MTATREDTHRPKFKIRQGCARTHAEQTCQCVAKQTIWVYSTQVR